MVFYLRLNLITVILLGLIHTSGHAQKFWLTTYEFPGGPKTGITKIGDSCLIVGLTDGVLRSFNEGKKWDNVLKAAQVFSVFATETGSVFAGGGGKVYVSENYGSTWDSVSLNNNYPVIQFTRNATGDIFAITGVLDNALGYVGAGVYFSDNQGKSWSQRNNGLGNYLSCNQIAVDRNGRLYLTVADELADGAGGLFISENKGLLWEHIDIAIDGDGVINDNISVLYSAGLSISPHDSVYLHVDGIAVNVGVRLNIYKHIDAVRGNGRWSRMTVNDNTPSWWIDRLLNGIYFSKKGDFYSSSSGSPAIGGTYFSRDQGINWNQQLQGLGFTIFGEFGMQSFTEQSSGKIFMVQYLDERIYWADTSLVTAVHDGIPRVTKQYEAYPNPADGNEIVKISFDNSGAVKTVSVFDISGKAIMRRTTRQDVLELEAPATPGIYLLAVSEESGGGFVKLIVQ